MTKISKRINPQQWFSNLRTIKNKLLILEALMLRLQPHVKSLRVETSLPDFPKLILMCSQVWDQ